MAANPLQIPPGGIGRWGTDPRPDLAEDSELWTRLLTRLFPLNCGEKDGLFGALHYLRCMHDLSIVRRPHGFSLVPADTQAEEFQDIRTRVLLPRAEYIKGLLSELL